MAVFLIAEAKKIMDKDGYNEYIRRVPSTIEKFGGKYRVRGGNVRNLSGDWDPNRIIIVEFGSMEDFNSWWDSPEYKEIAPLRERAAVINAVVVEGV